MSCDNLPTTAEIEQAKKDIIDFNTFMTSTSDTFVDSNGVSRLTLRGAIISLGFSPAGFDFATGGTLTERDKAIFYQDDGNWYSWGGVLPKAIPPASSPTSTGGIADNAWNVSTSAFMYRDWEGFTAELLAQGGVPDNGLPDVLGASKRVDAINELIVAQVSDLSKFVSRPSSMHPHKNKLSSGFVTFIYDDSFLSQYSIAYPIHKSAGVPACFAVTRDDLTRLSGKFSLMNLREMISNGMGVASHTLTHASLPSGVTQHDGDYEIVESKKFITDLGFDCSFYVQANSVIDQAKFLPTVRSNYIGAAVIYRDPNDPLDEITFSYDDDEYLYSRVNMEGLSIARAKEIIDYCAEKKRCVIFYDHEIGTGNHITSADLSIILDHVKSSGCDYGLPSEMVSKIRSSGTKGVNLSDVASNSTSTIANNFSPNILSNSAFKSNKSAGSYTVTIGQNEPDGWSFVNNGFVNPLISVEEKYPSNRIRVQTGSSHVSASSFSIFQQITIKPNALTAFESIPISLSTLCWADNNKTVFRARVRTYDSAAGGNILFESDIPVLTSTYNEFKKIRLTSFIPRSSLAVRIQVEIWASVPSGLNSKIYITQPKLSLSSGTSGFDSTDKPKAYGRSVIPQSTVAPNLYVPMAFSVSSADTNMTYNTATGEFLIPSNDLYTIESTLDVSGVDAGVNEFFGVAINGVPKIITTDRAPSPTAGHKVSGTFTIPAAAGDLLTVIYRHNSSSAAAINTGNQNWVTVYSR